MEQPVDVMEPSIDPDYETGYEILQVPWWVILLEGIIAILVGLFLLYRPAATTVFLVLRFQSEFLFNRKNPCLLDRFKNKVL